MANASWLAMGLIFGVLMTWFGILIAMICLPIARGEVKASEINYRPWAPKFVKAQSVEEADHINRQGAKWMLAYAAFMVILGFCAIALGIISIANPAILYLLAIIIITTIILGIYVYTFVYVRHKQHKMS